MFNLLSVYFSEKVCFKTAPNWLCRMDSNQRKWIKFKLVFLQNKLVTSPETWSGKPVSISIPVRHELVADGLKLVSVSPEELKYHSSPFWVFQQICEHWINIEIYVEANTLYPVLQYRGQRAQLKYLTYSFTVSKEPLFK
jgi:hypothetical protein